MAERVTRARAAKTTDPKTTRIVTAAAKTARSATTATTSTASKRKTRADEDDDGDHVTIQQLPVKALPAAVTKTTRATRGRAKKPVDEPSQPEPQPVKPTRGRPKKAVAPTTEEPTKSTRATRTKKAATTDEEPSATVEPPKRARGRPPSAASTVTASTAASRSLAKPAVKKTVKFEEPEKENIAPGKKSTAKAPEQPASGLKAKPIRRPGTATTGAATGARGARGARATTIASDKKEKPLPLSPKKVNQLAVNNRDNAADSEDELAMDEKRPQKALMKKPIKPENKHKQQQPADSRAQGALAPSPFPEPETEENDENEGPSSEPTLPTVILGSPARRPAPSPWKNSIKSPAKRVEGIIFNGAPTSQTTNGQPVPSSSPLKLSLLQTPAKRPPQGLFVGLGASTNANQAQSVSTSAMKMSLLSSPAKRPMPSPIKSMAVPPTPQATLLVATPLPAKEDGNIDCQYQEEDEDMVLSGDGEDDGIPDSPTRLRFPGRLSAVMPRHADPTLKSSMLALPEEKGEEEEEDDDDDVDGIEIREEVQPAVEEHVEDAGDPMIVDSEEVVNSAAAETENVNPACNNEEVPATFISLREKDIVPYEDDADTESEDESPALLRQQDADTFTFNFSGVPVGPATPNQRVTRRVSSRLSGVRNLNDRNLPSSGRPSTAKRVRLSPEEDEHKFGFTPLADQLSAWKAGASPLKTGSSQIPVLAANVEQIAEAQEQEQEQQQEQQAAIEKSSPAVQNTYFEDEMMIRPEPESSADNAEAEAEIDAMATEDEQEEDENEEDEDDTIPEIEDVPVTEEDVALAAEAQEMSLTELDQNQFNTSFHSSHDDTLSEASQEYGDENEVPSLIPIDPTVRPSSSNTPSKIPMAAVPSPVTPQERNTNRIPRGFHTVVSKVPLKPAADDEPPRSTNVKARRHSVSRLPVAYQPPQQQRPTHQLTRNATVISYSPTKKSSRRSSTAVTETEIYEDEEEENDSRNDHDLDEDMEENDEENVPEAALPPMTPQKSSTAADQSIWSTLGTPARTPRRDLDPALLRGAVVYVDVHTSEGADASGIFVELLGQMGARCVKNWSWNPSSDKESKVGITHVVFKDGGKRTLEKVRESRGVVQCVGVSWVLE